MSGPIELFYRMADRDKRGFRTLMPRREQFAQEALEIGAFLDQMSIDTYEVEIIGLGVLRFSFPCVAAAVAFKMHYHDNLISAEVARRYGGARSGWSEGRL